MIFPQSSTHSGMLPSEKKSNRDVECFQQLADGAPVLIWMSGPDMGCFYFNRAWLEFRGRTTEQEFGNGWAEGVHPDDLERCVQHYVSSFKKQVPFAMSYRLRHHSGEYRWILDRGAPHYTRERQFLGFFGGCVESPADTSRARIQQFNVVARLHHLRLALDQIRDFADRIAAEEMREPQHSSRTTESLQARTSRLSFEHRVRQNAADHFSRLATDMRTYDGIPNGVCLR